MRFARTVFGFLLAGHAETRGRAKVRPILAESALRGQRLLP